MLFDYPLQKPAVFRLAADTPAGFTRAGLVRAIAATYQRIYREEDATSVVPSGRVSSIRLHRNPTHGRYGVFGHDLEDLSLAAVQLPGPGEPYYKLVVTSEI